MRMSYFMQNCFTKYKIEKWNEKKQQWEFFSQHLTFFEARYRYKILIKNASINGIFRLISVLELDEIKEG